MRLDVGAFTRVETLRRSHFPSALNLIPAHLTLFHRLSGDITDILRETPRRSPFPLTFDSVRSLGRGVALNVASPELVAVRRYLAAAFADQLTPQDRQAFRPHVTVQNKVAPAEARALFEELASVFTPFTGWAEGLLLWRYLDGPWRLEAEFPFS